jgi:hypothetical protein
LLDKVRALAADTEEEIKQKEEAEIEAMELMAH